MVMTRSFREGFQYPANDRSCGQTGNLRNGLPFTALYTCALLPGCSGEVSPVVLILPPNELMLSANFKDT